jgi:hypothetical protein
LGKFKDAFVDLKDLNRGSVTETLTIFKAKEEEKPDLKTIKK